MKVGKTEERLYTESVVLVEIYEWAVISKPLGLNKKKHSRQQQRGNTSATFCSKSAAPCHHKGTSLHVTPPRKGRLISPKMSFLISSLLTLVSLHLSMHPQWAGLRHEKRTQVKETWMQFKRLEMQPICIKNHLIQRFNCETFEGSCCVTTDHIWTSSGFSFWFNDSEPETPRSQLGYFMLRNTKEDHMESASLTETQDYLAHFLKRKQAKSRVISLLIFLCFTLQGHRYRS